MSTLTGKPGRDLSAWVASDHVNLACGAGCIIQARVRAGAPARRTARRHVAATGHSVTIVRATWQVVSPRREGAIR